MLAAFANKDASRRLWTSWQVCSTAAVADADVGGRLMEAARCRRFFFFRLVGGWLTDVRQSFDLPRLGSARLWALSWQSSPPLCPERRGCPPLQTWNAWKSVCELGAAAPRWSVCSWDDVLLQKKYEGRRRWPVIHYQRRPNPLRHTCFTSPLRRLLSSNHSLLTACCFSTVLDLFSIKKNIMCSHALISKDWCCSWGEFLNLS